jgi:hypothetical protein
MLDDAIARNWALTPQRRQETCGVLRKLVSTNADQIV